MEGVAMPSIRSKFLFQAAAIVFLLSPTANADEAAKPARQSWVLIPSGIGTGDTIYVTGASESLVALDLESGEQLWESKEAQLPLAVVGDRVIARTSQNKLPTNAMQLVVLNAADGKVKMRCKQIAFPDWVSVGGGLGLSFDAVAAVEGDDLQLTWRAARELAMPQGKATPEMIAATKKTTTGLVHVDLQTGENEMAVDSLPKRTQLKRDMPYYDVGNKRLIVMQQTERVDGGVQLVHRTLEARDQKTGKPLWRQPIVGEVYLPLGPPPAVSRRPSQKTPTRR
jgi:hypothetical protein